MNDDNEKISHENFHIISISKPLMNL